MERARKKSRLSSLIEDKNEAYDQIYTDGSL
jgi:ribonuclease HI